MKDLTISDLGRVGYRKTWAFQKSLQSKLVDFKRGELKSYQSNHLLLLEHPHVYTLGKSGDLSNLLVSEEKLKNVGASLVEIDRGGDITYHGPGQLIAYPILDLDRYDTDIGKYLRNLEEVVIRVCHHWSIDATRVEGRTGVWVRSDSKGPERKICAMGIRCSRWVTMHGLAINVDTNLKYFELMNPCGITDRGVSSIAKEIGSSPSMDEVKTVFTKHFLEVFESHLSSTEGYTSIPETIA